MRIAFLFSLVFGFAACGVKKNPDAYYNHPLQFDDAPLTNALPSPTSTPGGIR